MTNYKQVWVDALRSGDFEQCQGTLHNGKGYCCLGVAAKVWGIADGPEMLVQDFTEAEEGPYKVYDAVRKLTPRGIYHDGIDMNDGGKSFKAIADMIEEKWV